MQLDLGFGLMKREILAFSIVSMGAVLGFMGQAEARCVDLAQTPEAKENCTIKAGSITEARLVAFKPTQPSLGFDELHYRLGRFEFGKDKINKRFDDWCESSGLAGAEAVSADARLSDSTTFKCKLQVGSETPASLESMKTAIVGPGGQLYLTDGHHTFTSFMEARDGGPQTKVRVRVTHNFGDLDEAAFWSAMKTNKLVWLRDAEGREILPAQLPQSLGMKQFGDDKYRSVLYFGRDIGYKQLADNAAFQEFYWGSWLRNHPSIKLSNYKIDTLEGYLLLLKDVTQAQSALADETVIADGLNAKQLGKLTPWNSGAPETAGEFGKQSAPYSDAKPGKLAYVFEYRKARSQ